MLSPDIDPKSVGDRKGRVIKGIGHGKVVANLAECVTLLDCLWKGKYFVPDAGLRRQRVKNRFNHRVRGVLLWWVISVDELFLGEHSCESAVSKDLCT